MAAIRTVLCGVLIAACLAGCSSVRPWINAPLVVDSATTPPIAASADPSIVVAVTLSGGGARAAAFGYGVLTELHRTTFRWNGRETDLLTTADVITGVSGGSILAAYYAAFGVERLPDFERDFLRQNFQNGLITQTLRPVHLYKMTSPWYGRSNVLAERLDELYEGRTFADVEDNPPRTQLIIAATDMSLGTTFEFTREQFALICSDLRSVPLAFAVAASSAVPIVLSPMGLKNYAGECLDQGVRTPEVFGAGTDYRARMYRSQSKSYLDAKRRPYIHLVDGGLADNLGVRRMLDRALAGGGLRRSLSNAGLPPGSIRKLVLVTVNSERDPANNIDADDKVPGLAQVSDALLFGTGSRATIETQEFLTDITRQWRADLKTHRGDGSDAFAADAEIHVVAVNLRDAEGDTRRELLQTPTAFSISGWEVTQLIDAGRDVLRRSPEFQALLKSLGAKPD
ncbi:patatin-like phospholipase family protein [Variovorax sp. J22R24]|uniref:patatin-like phospholipase family protein n=1 Tax=Variovorax gracilis TaxID=3053502 RepID=UPI0025785027|nr:patatin-like phospholipase family protein [Variovorax sp. J22R24]MDM0105452.1 patatin-like phospholipase family protein [Variovorax sp. J22R24]